MPEATILYSVTGTVVAGLVVWVIMVLNGAKQPWVRVPVEAPAAEEEPAALVDTTAPASTEPTSSPDDTARQTPVALSTGRAKAAVLDAKVDAKVAEAELDAEKEAEKKAESST